MIWNAFLETVNKYALLKTNSVKRKHQPDCLTSDILDLMKARENYEINGKMDEYQIIGNKISKMIDKANEPVHEISNNVVCATSKSSDQPAHTRSLIRAFARRLNIIWVLSY